MAKLSNKGLLGMALLLSLATSVLVYHYLKTVSTVPQQKEVSVVVARADIPPRTRIQAGMVKEVRVPEQFVEPNAVHELAKVVGVVAREQIMAGEQITERRLVIAGKPADFTGMIPSDERAVTVAVTEVTGVAGFVKPGDYVDVLATFDQSIAGENVTKMILQDILVLATNHDAQASPANVANAGRDKKDAGKTSTVTLAVTPEQAAQLALMDEKGKIRLALRPFIPSTGIVIANTVTPRDLVGNFSLPGPSKTPDKPAPKAEPAPPAGKALPDGHGIQMIRGTKVETVTIN
ncbi:flp pilus assembly protein rcpc/cpab [Lucifera butyrica]|uniref:Flp pilus assembly protein rcpc/cpab n=1 Tax=Lucifera butyrica TaxID=1351585 RepID=A0A498RF00_9FIRM|nr:Flp pilus assembly protein CpaB [Lucifera butyrica]VBB09899.1 flp pilus assembly protein rcpc/cpab [Lucifera butyrica]